MNNLEYKKTFYCLIVLAVMMVTAQSYWYLGGAFSQANVDKFDLDIASSGIAFNF